MMVCFIFGLALGVVVGMFCSFVRVVRAIKRGDINAQAGIGEKITVGISVDWPEILALAAVALITFLLWGRI